MFINKILELKNWESDQGGGGVHDFRRGAKSLRGGAHLPSKSGHGTSAQG